MKTLITGGSGFIGSKLLDSIENSKSFDINSSKKMIDNDISIYNNILKASENMDGIIHLAAVSRVSDCENNANICAKINIIGTLNVIEAAISNNVKWLALVTTGEVKWIQNDDVQSFNKINNIYGVTKLTNELFLDIYNKKHSFSSIIFRISSVVFGDATDNQDKVFPVFVKKAINNENIVIRDADYKMDFIHIDNVILMINDTIKNIPNDSKTILEVDISSGIKLDLISLAKIIHYISKSSSVIEYDSSFIKQVSKIEYNNLIKENNINDKFISSITDSIIEYRKIISFA